MKIAIGLAFLGFMTVSSYAQVKVTRFTVPFCGSVNLAEVDDKYNAQVFSLEMPEPDSKIEWLKLRDAKKTSAALFPRKVNRAAQKTTAVQPPLVAISYVADSFPGIPPDNYMAINKNHQSVAVMNSHISVHNAQTGLMTYRRSLKLFSSKVNLQGLNDYRYDPKIIYDQDADRFICVMLNSTNQYNYIVVGFSKSNRPDSGWNFYKFYGDYSGDTTWFDYPSIAITHKEIFLTGNKIKFNTSWQEGFSQSIVYQIRKQDGYDSLNLNVQLWENIAYNGRNLRNLHPVKGGGSIKGPEQYFLSNRNFDVQNDTVFLVKLPDTIGSGNTSLTVTPLVSNIPYGVPPEGRQPNPAATLATNDGRILGAFAEGNEIQFVSTTVHPVSGSSAIYHGTISSYATAPAVQASYFGVDTLDLGYPNISYCGNNNTAKASIISFNYTGPQNHPGMGAVCYDGSQYSDINYIKIGAGSIKQLPDTLQRWGDYTGSQPDWSDNGSVWVVGIYGRADNEYGNYMAKLISPFTNSIGAQNVLASPVTLYPNPAFEYVKFEFDLQAAADLSFTVYTLDGKKTDEILRYPCARGKNRVQFNIASLAPGIYFLRVNAPGGKEIAARRFIKQ